MDSCLYCGGCLHFTLLAAMMKRKKTMVCPHCGKEQEVLYDYWKNCASS